MAKKLRIQSVGKTNQIEVSKQINEIAGDDWKHTVQEAICYIKNNTYEYYIKDQNKETPVIVAMDNENEYLKAYDNALNSNILLSLPRLLSYEELIMQLQNQIWFLIDSCNAFDQGVYAEAIRLAATIRVLLHDTRKSKSLLGQLGFKTSFFDTTTKIPSDIESSIKGVPSSLKLINRLIENPVHQYKPNFGRPEDLTRSDFETWWNQTVISDIEGHDFSRDRIIMCAADQDGGAHVDPALEEDYYKLTRLNSVGHFISTNIDLSKGFPESIPASQIHPLPSPLGMFYTIRQIAHEVLISRIDPSKGELSQLSDNIYPYDEQHYEGVAVTMVGLY